MKEINLIGIWIILNKDLLWYKPKVISSYPIFRVNKAFSNNIFFIFDPVRYE